MASKYENELLRNKDIQTKLQEKQKSIWDLKKRIKNLKSQNIEILKLQKKKFVLQTLEKERFQMRINDYESFIFQKVSNTHDKTYKMNGLLVKIQEEKFKTNELQLRLTKSEKMEKKITDERDKCV